MTNQETATSSAAPETLTVVDPDGETIYVYRWRPEQPARAIVQLLHGMGEHAGRYARLAHALTDAGYVVYADDHRASGRTGVEGPGLGDLGPRGMEGTVDAVHAVTDRIRAEEPGLDVFLLGHSWGSLIAQRIALQWGDELAGLLLSGSTLLIPEYANLEGWNDPFEPAATPYDWLSRDPEEVQRYIDDAWCGFEIGFPTEELAYLFGPPTETMPTDLPVLVFNGTMDAVGGWNGGGQALTNAYRALGVKDVTYHAYDGGRHELFNETNRDEVTADVIGWLDSHQR